ncbi:AbrB/MazE/SpoVT family DNA-binding domain-containing protein [Natrinema salsiterrestre]|uniref:AbrB/MazE/SpoVT family DNA-binding domain-containing protein n=1 Tax=Natrinema salsiterrestre TaxID=2950540 RepID=A0A9Q4KZ18_9EURY|nr:AbrB/MazE/SpoVT family DNA-binding domain-containing protein [Natrinema salsiterrestre]MDF9744094.1 AbrB/MazE/SpoVT family DNA-binding domain-containing protein [Natrinema salsiterrestre]
MVTVDSKGRVVLPQEVRNRLGISPGTEVEIREENGKAVVEPEDEPDRIVDDFERLIDDAAAYGTRDSYEDLDSQSKHHADAIKRHANEHSPDDE